MKEVIPSSQGRKVRVWDLPTRLFHWLLAALVVGLFASAWMPGVPLEWHARLGYGVLALLLFRLAWGAVGGHWSRFRTFVPSAREIRAHLRGDERRRLGHNPLGALSVLAMLVALGVQAGTGLIADDEIAFTGPLNRFVSAATGLAATRYHAEVGAWIVLALVLLHLLAIGFYRWVRQRDLVGPMIHGDQLAPGTGTDAPSSRDGLPTRLLGLGLMALSIALVLMAVQAAG